MPDAKLKLLKERKRVEAGKNCKIWILTKDEHAPYNVIDCYS